MAKKNYSGKFVIRIDPKLHKRISDLADKKNISLNELVNNSLQETSQRQLKKDLV